jgi:hypothetical protein
MPVEDIRPAGGLHVLMHAKPQAAKLEKSFSSAQSATETYCQAVLRGKTRTIGPP